MGHYAAINLRIKLKKDAPEYVHQFMDTYFFETDIEKALANLETAPVTPLCALKYYPEEITNLNSMIAQRSVYHKHWCWRSKEVNPDYVLYESKASCNHRSVDEDLIALLMSGLLPYLVTDHDNILARVIYEDSILERVAVIDAEQQCVTMTGGYQHRYHHDCVCMADTHPQEESDQYDEVLSDTGEFEPFVRLIPLTQEFYPPWNLAELVALNDKIKTAWGEERAVPW